MPTTLLAESLEQHKTLLGPNFEILGKSTGCGLCGRRIAFLSYSVETGWAVVQLNSLQLFLRTYFGCYASTHFECIAKAWSKDVTGVYVNNALDNRILSIWQKKHMVSYGNCDPQNAELICFGEKHTATLWRKANWLAIKQLYKPGDLILIEGLKSQTKITYHDLPVQGWEPVASLKLPTFIKHQQWVDRLVKLNKKSESIKGSSNPLTKSKATQLVNKFLEVNSYFKGDSINSKVVNSLLSNNSHTLAEIVWYLSLQLLKNSPEKIRYQQPFSQKELKKMNQAFAKRNESLCEEIELGRREGRRVIVLAGCGHFFQFPNNGNIDKVKETLKKYRFASFIKQKFFEKQKLASLNQDLVVTHLTQR
jgi:hypothetical protein